MEMNLHQLAATKCPPLDFHNLCSIEHFFKCWLKLCTDQLQNRCLALGRLHLCTFEFEINVRALVKTSG